MPKVDISSVFLNDVDLMTAVIDAGFILKNKVDNPNGFSTFDIEGPGVGQQNEEYVNLMIDTMGSAIYVKAVELINE